MDSVQKAERASCGWCLRNGWSMEEGGHHLVDLFSLLPHFPGSSQASHRPAGSFQMVSLYGVFSP